MRRAQRSCFWPAVGTLLRIGPLLTLAIGLGKTDALACPFCVSRSPTLSERSGAADVVLWGEVVGRRDGQVTLAVEQICKGDWPSAELQLGETLASPAAGSLLLALGRREFDPSGVGPAVWNWQTEPLDETRLGYLVRAPAAAAPATERLAYFARFLEHPDAWIAADAYGEFAAAPFEVVRQASGQLDVLRLAGWLDSAAVLPERKGLYGLLLGLVGRQQAPQRNAALLKRAVHAEANDFRAGFAGLVAGYLWCGELEALADVRARFVDRAEAAEGDVRHVLAALEFIDGQWSDPARLAVRQSLEGLLRRPSVAPEVIAYLAQRQWAPALTGVVGLYDRAGYPQPATRRAVVDYLVRLETPEARQTLEQLRRKDPGGVAEAEAFRDLRPVDR